MLSDSRRRIVQKLVCGFRKGKANGKVAERCWEDQMGNPTLLPTHKIAVCCRNSLQMHPKNVRNLWAYHSRNTLKCVLPFTWIANLTLKNLNVLTQHDLSPKTVHHVCVLKVMFKAEIAFFGKCETLTRFDLLWQDSKEQHQFENWRRVPF